MQYILSKLGISKKNTKINFGFLLDYFIKILDHISRWLFIFLMLVISSEIYPYKNTKTGTKKEFINTSEPPVK